MWLAHTVAACCFLCGLLQVRGSRNLKLFTAAVAFDVLGSVLISLSK